MRSSLRTARPASGIAVGFVLSASLLSGVLHAEPPDDSRAQADALFREGQRLMTAGEVGTACGKLEDSQRLDPKLGRLLNVAYCHELLGRTATAWSEYNQAAALALQSGQSERESFARKQAGALARKLSFVQIDVSATPDLSSVTVDGRQLEPDQWSLPFPIDPGSHVLTFAEAGHKTRTQTVAVVAAGTLRVMVEPPEPERPLALSPSPSTPAMAKPMPAETASPSEGHTLGWILGAAGGAALGVGAGFGIRAMSLKGEADPLCPNRLCTPLGSSLIGDAKTSAAVATVGFVVGVVGVGAGAWLVLQGPSHPSRSQVAAYLAPDCAGIALRGPW